MVATLVGFFVAREAVQLGVRPHLLAPVSAFGPSTLFGPSEGAAPTRGAWILSTRSVSATGHVLDPRAAERIVARTCHITRNTRARDLTVCASRAGIRDLVSMQPASRFWAFQVSESAIFIGLAAVLVGACIWWIRRRSA